MDPEQMQKRAHHSPMAGTGWLHGWRLTFGGEDFGWEGALATVVEDPDSKVFVVLYDMTPADEKNLDRWEGSELGVHKKIRCRVERLSSDTTTDPVLAWLYVLDAWEGGPRLGSECAGQPAAAPAGSHDANDDALVGALHRRGAGGIEGKRGASNGGGAHERAAIDIV